MVPEILSYPTQVEASRTLPWFSATSAGSLSRNAWKYEHSPYKYHASSAILLQHPSSTPSDVSSALTRVISYESKIIITNQSTMASILSCLMGMGSRLISYLESLKNKIWISSSRRSVTLQSLPVELLQQIAHELPPESIMALMLTCKEFSSILQHMQPALRDDPFVLATFLYALTRDLGPRNVFLCGTCNKIHWWRRKQWNGHSYLTCPYRTGEFLYRWQERIVYFHVPP